MLLNEWWYDNMYKWCHESRKNYTFIKLKAMKISKRCVLFWSRGPDGYRKNDRKRAVVWPWLVLELSTVWALTQLGIRQSDWRRAGIRSTNLHIVVELPIYHQWRPGPDHPVTITSGNTWLHYVMIYCLRAIPLEILQPLITKIILKGTSLKFHSNLPGINELQWRPFIARFIIANIL